MRKTELVAAISDRTGYDEKSTKAFLDAFIHVVTRRLSKGEKVCITGFGTFSKRKRAGRTYEGFGGRKKKGSTSIPYFCAGDVLTRAIRKG